MLELMMIYLTFEMRCLDSAVGSDDTALSGKKEQAAMDIVVFSGYCSLWPRMPLNSPLILASSAQLWPLTLPIKERTTEVAPGQLPDNFLVRYRTIAR
jgi:hypothetical protein